MSDGITEAYRLFEEESPYEGRTSHYRDAVSALIQNFCHRGDMIGAAEVVEEYNQRFPKGDFWQEAFFHCKNRL